MDSNEHIQETANLTNQNSHVNDIGLIEDFNLLDPFSDDEIDSNETKNKSNGENQESTLEKSPFRKRLLRERNAIQVHPFTLEYAQYKRLLHRTKLQKSFKAIFDQPPPEELEEEMHSQYIPPDEEDPDKDMTFLDQPNSIPDSLVLSQEKEGDSSHFEKYGLDKLILPPLTNKRKIDKIITFTKKRKPRQSRTTPNKYPRLKTSKDVFEFEERPSSIFNLTGIKKNMRPVEDTSSDLDDDPDSTQLHFRRRKFKRRSALLDSDEEEVVISSDEEEKASLSQEEVDDSIFDFPSDLGNDDRRQIDDDNELVPIVEDELEFKDPKKPRVKLKDVIRTQKALKSVLPASFMKIYQKEILEEDKKPKGSRKSGRSKMVTKSNGHSSKPIEDVFAEFLSSESEECEMSDSNDLVSQIQEQDDEAGNSLAPKETTKASTDNQNKPNISQNKYPARIPFPHVRSAYKSRSNVNPNPKPRSKKPKKKKVKRTKDDIYVHAPYISRWYDKSGQVPTYHNNTLFVNQTKNIKRKPFDDIYIGTKQLMRYASEAPNPHTNKEKIKNHDLFKFFQDFRLVYSLGGVAKRISRLFDHDLRRIKNLNESVYLNQHLIGPLLSGKPHQKELYERFKETYRDLVLFQTHLIWTDIIPKESQVLNSLFFKLSKDIRLSQNDPTTDLVGHDHFYTFVSLCLAIWIPSLADPDKEQMRDLFMIHIRNLAWMIPKMMDQRNRYDLPLKILIRLLIYLLDWTCRLEQLEVRPLEWSILEYTTILIDVLVYLGHEEKKIYIIEAWICLIQVVSSKKFIGYNENLFIQQLKTSIKKLAVDELEIRKKSRMWAEFLNYILDTYMT